MHPTGLGSSLQGEDHGRTLVTDRGLVPHKLPGNASSLPSPSVLYEGHSSPHSLSLHGQHHSNLIPKPQRRDNFPLPLHASKTNLAVVHVPEHPSSCQSPTWTSQYSGRQRVQGTTGQMGLANPSKIFLKINQILGPLTIDLFASRLTQQLPAYFSWRPDPQASAMDAFLQDWSGKICYANLPWGLMLKVLSEISHQQADVIKVAPVWKGQSWFPVLLPLLLNFPHLVLSSTGPILSQQSMPPPFKPQEVQLAMWPTSGNTANQKNFQNKLQNFSLHPGDTSPPNLTTHTFTSGSAGVLHGIEILFQVLKWTSLMFWQNYIRKDTLIAP